MGNDKKERTYTAKMGNSSVTKTFKDGEPVVFTVPDEFKDTNSKPEIIHIEYGINDSKALGYQIEE